MRQLIVFILLLLPAVSANAQKSDRIKPRWISETPSPCNPTYDFVITRGVGDSPETASKAAFDKLVENERLKRSVEIIYEQNRHNVQRQDYYNGKLREHISNNITLDVTVKGEKINITVNRIDEYWEFRNINGRQACECYSLYMVAVTALPPVYDNVTLTEHYGARGLARSIIPGWGQIYKGSTTKGLCIIGGEAICVAGIILSESTRASYIRKMKEQPRHAKHYNSLATNWETGRNICIGAAAVLYIYNLIDAAASKGARRVNVKPHREIRLALSPSISSDCIGIGLALNF